MEKFKVSFEANNQQLKSIGTKHASDTYADIEATFVLGEKWTDMDSVSAVWWNDFTRVATVLDSQGKCVVPHEVLTRKGCVRVNLVGSIVEGDELITRLTSYSAEAVQVNEKIKLTGSETSEITPSQYEQFVANVKADADRAEAGATASANSADEAEASAQNASESASASAVSASDSARSATASAGYAQNASESAQSAENAKDDAEDARDEILGMRATAETLEAGSDATASYSDGLLTLGIPRGDQGIQGIQGETGATPNLTIGTVETLEPTEDATASITGTAENPVLNLGLPKGDTGEVSLEDLGALLPTDTASGDIASITDGQSVVPVKSLKVTLEPIQDLHGYDKPWSGGAGANKWDEEWELGGLVWANGEPFSATDRIRSKNFCPILPNTSYYCLRVGANSGGVFFYDENHNFISYDTYNKIVTTPSNAHYFKMGNIDGTTYNHDIAINYPSSVTTYSPYSNICPIIGHTECVTIVASGQLIDTSTNQSGAIDASGNEVANATFNRTDFIPIDKARICIKTNLGSGYVIRVHGYSTSKAWVQQIKAISTDGTNMLVEEVVPSGVAYVRLSYPLVGVNNTELWQGDTYTTDLGRTVYGADVEVVGGQLTDKMGMVDLGDLNWRAGTDSIGQYFLIALNGAKATQTTAQIANALCSIYPIAPSNNVVDGSLAIGTGATPNAYVRDTRFSDVASFKSAMSGVQLCYELATPQTIQLTPQEIKLLLGTNNVWSDGNVTLVYSADIQRWVEKKLNGNSTTSMLTMSRPMVQTETTETEETETETAETE